MKYRLNFREVECTGGVNKSGYNLTSIKVQSGYPKTSFGTLETRRSLNQ